MLKVTICIGSSCHLKGSKEVVDTLEKLIAEHHLEEEVELQGSFCMDHCVKGVCVKVNDDFFSLTPDKTEHFFYEEIIRRQG